MKAATLYSKHVKQENYRLFVVINIISYFGFVAHLAFVPLFLSIDLHLLAYFNVFSIFLWVAAHYLNKKGHHVEAIVLVVFEVVVHAILASYYLGWDSGFHYYFMPLVLFFFINQKQKLPQITLETLVVLVVYLALMAYTRNPSYTEQYSPALISGLLFMNITVNLIAIGLLGYGLRTASVRVESEMEKLAVTDSLTGLYNRRKMYEMIDNEQTRLKRSGKSFIVVLTDIDLFKHINDEYGHDCGDYVLKEVSSLMRSSLRKQDLLARWGGEEFVLLLPETSISGATKVIEHLRTVIAEHRFQFAHHDFTITMTFGMALYDDSQSIERVLKEADLQLYRGKASGRNCVMQAVAVAQ